MPVGKKEGSGSDVTTAAFKTAVSNPRMGHKQAKSQPVRTKRRKKVKRHLTDKCGLNDEQIAEFKEVFALFDKDRDGILTTQEVVMALKALGHNSTEGEIIQVVNEVDEIGEGTLDFPEFVQMMSTFMKQSTSTEELSDLFEAFDKDKDGYISAPELKHMMTELGESMTDTEILEMIKVADIDKDGMVSFNEFMKIMQAK